MIYVSVFYLFLINLIWNAKCDPSLQIMKNVDNNLLPVSTSVEEFRGSRFTLLCELVSAENRYFDNQIYWIKHSNEAKTYDGTIYDISNSSMIDNYVDNNGVNKAIKKFDPLTLNDGGTYTCASFKFMLFKSIKLVVMNDKPVEEIWQIHETLFCNDNMFRCVLNGLCIPERFVCDGKMDCRDGSDETQEICNGDACKDKLRCDDGRCIPTAWCCDKYIDPNCSIMVRPSCCQLLPDIYGEMEYHYISNVRNNNQNGTRYLFISICSLSIVFSMAVFILVVMKILIIAKRSASQNDNLYNMENIGLQNQSNLIQGRHAAHAPCNVYGYRISRVPQDDTNFVADSTILEPLFQETFGERLYDNPPSYSEITKNYSETSDLDLPPPYTSRECLNN